MIGKVKQLLEELEGRIKRSKTYNIGEYAQQICQLYEADMKHLSHLIDDVIELEEKVKGKDAEATAYYAEMIKVAIDKIRNKKDAECQERVDKLISGYTFYIEARKSDLTGMPSRSIPHSMALQVRRDTLDFALKAFIELANK